MEIQKAEALAENYCFEWDTWIEPVKTLADLVRDDRRAIVERCLELATEWYCADVPEDELDSFGRHALDALRAKISKALD